MLMQAVAMVLCILKIAEAFFFRSKKKNIKVVLAAKAPA